MRIKLAMESYNKKIIEEGVIKKYYGTKNNKNHKNLNYKMKFLNMQFLEQILEVQSEVEKNLNNPELFQTDTKDFIANMLDEHNGRIIGVFVEGKLVAYHTMLFPYKDSHNLGIDLDLSGGDLDKVAHLESSAVIPDFRGNALHTKMQSRLIKLAKSLGFRHLGVTIAPNNYPSIKASLNLGLYILRLKAKYSGKLRYIFYQNLESPLQIDENSKIEVRNTNTEKQKALLNNNAFCGFSAIKAKSSPYDDFTVLYAKIV